MSLVVPKVHYLETAMVVMLDAIEVVLMVLMTADTLGELTV